MIRKNRLLLNTSLRPSNRKKRLIRKWYLLQSNHRRMWQLHNPLQPLEAQRLLDEWGDQVAVLPQVMLQPGVVAQHLDGGTEQLRDGFLPGGEQEFRVCHEEVLACADSVGFDSTGRGVGNSGR